MRDASFVDVDGLVRYIYRGEVDVRQDRLQSFLRTAELLKIKGLAEQNLSGHLTAASGQGEGEQQQQQQPQLIPIAEVKREVKIKPLKQMEPKLNCFSTPGGTSANIMHPSRPAPNGAVGRGSGCGRRRCSRGQQPAPPPAYHGGGRGCSGLHRRPLRYFCRGSPPHQGPCGPNSSFVVVLAHDRQERRWIQAQQLHQPRPIPLWDTHGG